MLARFATCSDRAQALQVRLLVTDQAYKIQLAQFLFASRQRGRRDFDRVIVGAPVLGQRFQDEPCLLTTPAAKFGNMRRKRHARNYFRRIPLQQARISSS